MKPGFNFLQKFFRGISTSKDIFEGNRLLSLFRHKSDIFFIIRSQFESAPAAIGVNF